MPELISAVVPAGRLREREQPRLAVDELVLRPWEPGDASAVAAAYADPEIRRWHARSMTEAEALEWVRSWPQRWSAETAASWAIVEGERLMGRAGLRALSLANGSAEAAYWVLPSARGRGVASRALAAVTDWIFEHVGLHRIELIHAVENEPSCRVAHNAGYKLEGTMRGEGLHADGWHDMHLHARLSDDPRR